MCLISILQPAYRLVFSSGTFNMKNRPHLNTVPQCSVPNKLCLTLISLAFIQGHQSTVGCIQIHIFFSVSHFWVYHCVAKTWHVQRNKHKEKKTKEEECQPCFECIEQTKVDHIKILLRFTLQVIPVELPGIFAWSVDSPLRYFMILDMFSHACKLKHLQVGSSLSTLN